MAAPVPETDSGFTRRTAIQPSIANSPPAGGEAPVKPEPAAPRPNPFAKLPPRPAPAPSTKPPVSSGQIPAAPASSSSAASSPSPAAPTSADWGLASKPPKRAGWTFKLAALVGLLASAGGGYFAWQKYYPGANAPAADDGDSPDLANSDADEKSETSLGAATRDPFDDALQMSSDDSDEPKAREPRKMRTPSKAAPITHRDAGANSAMPAHRPPAREDYPLSLDDDDSEPSQITQAEPDADGDWNGPVLERPAEAGRKSAAAGRSGNRAAGSAKPVIRPNAGPRLRAISDRDADLTDELTADKLEGFDPAEPRNSRTATPATRGPKIARIDASDEVDADERIDGFTVDDATTRRAVTKTRIVRSLDDESVDERPKSSPENRTRVHRPAADDFSDSGDAAGDQYRVQPDDNFWKISRKQYGSSRYYQALMRHNLDRVPDPQKLRPGTQISTPSASFLERKYPDLIEKSSAAASPQTSTQGSGGRSRFERPTADRGFDQPPEREPARAAANGYFYSKSGDPMYRIGADDTLTSIAQKHLGRASRWTEIYEQNQDILGSPDNLTLGTVIRLPSDASRLSLVPENDRRR